jgi:hypothetical protein
MKATDFTPGRIADLVGLAAILSAGAYGIFVLPYSFPSEVPVFDTPAYNVGFNSGIAVLALLGLLGILCLRNLFWRPVRPEPVDSILWSDEPGGARRYPRMSPAIFFLFATIYVVLTGFLYAFIPHLEDFGEAAGAISRLHYALRFDLSPYRDFDFPYGPLLLYFPVAIIKLTSGLFYTSFEFGYLVSLLAAWLAGLWSLFYIIDHFRIKTAYRVVIFSALAIAGYDLGFGLAGTMLRYVTPFAVALMMHKASNRIDASDGWKAVAKLSGIGFIGIFIVFAISLEFGFIFGIAYSVYCVHRTLFDRRTWLFPLLVAGAAYPIWMLVFPHSLDRILGAGRGFSNFPVLPALYILLYVLSILWVVPILLRSGVSLNPSRNVSFFLMWAVLIVGVIPASLGRCEHKHCLLNGLGVFIVILPVLAKFRPSTFPIYTALFVMIFGVVWRVVDVVDYGPNFAPMRLALAGALAPERVDEAALVRGLGLDQYTSIALPMDVDRHTRKYLLDSGRLAPQYYMAYGSVASEKELTRKINDLKNAKYVVVPEGILPLRSMSDAEVLAYRQKQQEQTDVRHSIWLATLFLYPMKFQTKYLPFDPMLEEAKYIARNYEVVRQASGYLLMKLK